MLAEHLIEVAAAARVALDEADAAHCHDLEEVKRLDARIEQCTARQTEITMRRLAGTSTESETAEYAALAGDVGVLNTLLEEARACALASMPKREAAALALAHAEAELQEYQSQAAFEAVVEHARAAERVYVQCLHAVWTAARERGHVRTFGEAYEIDNSIMSLCRWNSWNGLSR